MGSKGSTGLLIISFKFHSELGATYADVRHRGLEAHGLRRQFADYSRNVCGRSLEQSGDKREFPIRGREMKLIYHKLAVGPDRYQGVVPENNGD
jgi:hypothetical protein